MRISKKLITLILIAFNMLSHLHASTNNQFFEKCYSQSSLTGRTDYVGRNSIKVNNSKDLLHYINDNSINEIVLSAGFWQSSTIQQALNSRKVSSPLTICGESSNNTLKTTINGLYATNATSFKKKKFYQIAYTGTDFPLVFHNGEQLTVKQTPLLKMKENISIIGNASSGKVLALSCSDWTVFPLSGDKRVNILDVLQEGSIISITISFFNLRFRCINTKGKEISVSSESQVNINYLNSLFKANIPCHIKVYNTKGQPGTNEFTYNGKVITCQIKKASSKAEEFELAQSGPLLKLEKKQNITFSDIIFSDNGVAQLTKGFSIHRQSEDQTESSILLRGCQNIVFQNCGFHNLMGYAIGTDSYRDGTRCAGITISGCTISDTQGGGIHLNNTDNSIIINNQIIGFGQTMMASCGILLRYGCGNTIIGNTISDGYYTGISAGWNWDWQYTIQGTAPTGDNLIKGNTIHHCMKGNIMEDGGGIYTLGGTERTVIEDNTIYDMDECRGANASAIYLDQATTEVTVRNNICWNNRVNLHVNYGYHNYVTGNIFAYPTEKNIWFDNSKDFLQKAASEKNLPNNRKTVIKSGVAFYSIGNTYIQEGGTLIHLGATHSTLDGQPCYTLEQDTIDNCGRQLNYLEYPDNNGRLLLVEKINYNNLKIGSSSNQVKINASKCVKVSCADRLFESQVSNNGRSKRVWKGLPRPTHQ